MFSGRLPAPVLTNTIVQTTVPQVETYDRPLSDNEYQYVKNPQTWPTELHKRIRKAMLATFNVLVSTESTHYKIRYLDETLKFFSEQLSAPISSNVAKIDSKVTKHVLDDIRSKSAYFSIDWKNPLSSEGQNIDGFFDIVIDRFKMLLLSIRELEERTNSANGCQSKIEAVKRRYSHYLDELQTSERVASARNVIVFQSFAHPLGIGCALSHIAICLARGIYSSFE